MMRWIGVLGSVCLLAGCGLLARYDDGNALVEAVRTQVDRAAPQGDGGGEQAPLRRFYEARSYRAAWQGRQGEAALQALLRSGTHGLDPMQYHATELAEQRQKLDGRTPDGERAAWDVAMTRSLLHLAVHLGQGQVQPDLRQAKNAPARPAMDPVAALERAANGNPAAELDALAPENDAYVRLRHALARLHGIAAAGGWGTVPAGPATGPALVALRHRLAAEGLVPVEQTPAFDAALAGALKRFQEDHGLPATGKVDDATRAELNVPVEDRIETVQLNLERLRWMRRPAAPRGLTVNIPAFELELRDAGKAVLTSRIVVGKSWSPTPVFSDEVVSVIVNPVWNVPGSITRDEIAPAMQRDPGYLARQHMRVFRGEEEIDPSSVDWSALPETVSVRQDPGNDNALGRVKFQMPNKFDIYLHDTPAGHLFAKETRAFSHGCIRVEKPLELAAALLADQPTWTPPRIEEAIASEETREVKLTRPLPIDITYFTAWTTSSGELRFGPDVYGLDRELAAALKGRRPDDTVARGLLRSKQRSAPETAPTGGSTPWL
ncbi:MAG TPA: L,D-transpeptidase family protein [Candidatus Polarisedimenticolaceae bacterium]|nr:L,D-transpeptidase family protein [Candidatus Polarisedimenticolaceae bacterium]